MKTRTVNKAPFTKPRQFKDHTDFRLWIEYYAIESERNEIVRAVNVHEELLQLLRISKNELSRDPSNNGLVPLIEQAIAKAEGK